jgi:hypothetical protein
MIPSFICSGFISQSAVKYRPNLHSPASYKETEGFVETFDGEMDDILLRINFSFVRDSDDDAALALAAVQQYTKSFPFAAVLPVQPLTYLPVQMPDGNVALKITFLRKKTEEKDSKDGGLLFESKLAPIGNNDDNNGRQKIHLVAKRISKGQTVSKIFSEKQIIMAFVKGIDEARGRDLLKNANVRLESMFHQWISI